APTGRPRPTRTFRASPGSCTSTTATWSGTSRTIAAPFGPCVVVRDRSRETLPRDPSISGLRVVPWALRKPCHGRGEHSFLLDNAGGIVGKSYPDVHATWTLRYPRLRMD